MDGVTGRDTPLPASISIRMVLERGSLSLPAFKSIEEVAVLKGYVLKAHSRRRNETSLRLSDGFVPSRGSQARPLLGVRTTLWLSLLAERSSVS